MENQKIKKTRVRAAANHKWSRIDEEANLNYLLNTIREGKQIEKPTAIIYYSALKASNSLFIDIPVVNIKNKSNNLRTSYKNALKWLQSTSQGEEEGTITKHVTKMCSHYEILKEIYSERPNIIPSVVIDSGLELLNVDIHQEFPVCFEVAVDVENNDISMIDELNSTIDLTNASQAVVGDNILTSSPPSTSMDRQLPETPAASTQSTRVSVPLNFSKGTFKRKKPSYTQNAVSKLAEMVKGRQDMMEKKFKLEKEKMDRQMRLEEDKIQQLIDIEQMRIAFEKEKMKAEINFQREMKMEELRKDERIKMKELELKYSSKRFK